MTSFGGWTCPRCRRKWVGSIGYWMESHGPRAFSRDGGSALGELLVRICGCTEKGLTKEDMQEMLVATVPMGTKIED